MPSGIAHVVGKDISGRWTFSPGGRNRAHEDNPSSHVPHRGAVEVFLSCNAAVSGNKPMGGVMNMSNTCMGSVFHIAGRHGRKLSRIVGDSSKEPVSCDKLNEISRYPDRKGRRSREYCLITRTPPPWAVEDSDLSRKGVHTGKVHALKARNDAAIIEGGVHTRGAWEWAAWGIKPLELMTGEIGQVHKNATHISRWNSVKGR